MHHHPAGRELLRLGEIADRADIVAVDHVVGRLYVNGGFVIKTFEVAAGLGEENEFDAFAGVALGEFEGAVGAVAGGFIIYDRAFDDAA
jgi:hypothetical protein